MEIGYKTGEKMMIKKLVFVWSDSPKNNSSKLDSGSLFM